MFANHKNSLRQSHYSQLYKPSNKPRFTPSKNQILKGVSFTKKASNKTLSISNTQQKISFNRHLTRSIEEYPNKYSIQNQQIQRRSIDKIQQSDGMFSKSFARIQKLKSLVINKNIDDELNDILELIKDQKSRINQRLKYLQSSNDYLRRICEGKTFLKQQASVNTEQLIGSGLQQQSCEKQIQCNLIQNSDQKVNQTQKDKKINQAYNKLNSMLLQMNIDPRLILPQEAQTVILQKPFKSLSDVEIIKIQQFFMKKLSAKMSK